MQAFVNKVSWFDTKTKKGFFFGIYLLKKNLIEISYHHNYFFWTNDSFLKVAFYRSVIGNTFILWSFFPQSLLLEMHKIYFGQFVLWDSILYIYFFLFFFTKRLGNIPTPCFQPSFIWAKRLSHNREISIFLRREIMMSQRRVKEDHMIMHVFSTKARNLIRTEMDLHMSAFPWFNLLFFVLPFLCHLQSLGTVSLY